jgi:uncharacterized protein (UPF0332 family)
VDPIEFLHVADRLKGSAIEGDRRTSISRSYYSLFNVLKQSLSELNKFLDDDQDHAALKYYLVSSKQRELSDIGQTLHNLRVSRNDADYKMQAEFTVSDSETVYARAKSAIAKFQAVPRHTLTGFVKAVPGYKFRT